MYIFLSSFIIFLSYLELSPKLGNIWYRYNSKNIKTINLKSLFNFISYTFKNKDFWYLSNWDLNIIIYYIFTNIIFLICRLFYNLIIFKKIKKKKVTSKIFVF